MYEASNDRYDRMKYQPCGKSGLKLPVVSLGLWHNFGDNAHYENMKALCFTAFDHGILGSCTPPNFCVTSTITVSCRCPSMMRSRTSTYPLCMT